MQKIYRLIRRDGFWYTFKRSWAWLIAHTPFAYRAYFRYTPTTRLSFTPTLLTYQIFANRNARSVDREWVCAQLSPGDTYIDVGANIGSLVVPAAATVGSVGCVLAFEPSPKFARVLTSNIELNRQTWVTVQPVALGAAVDTVYLDETAADDTTNHIATTGTKVAQAQLDSFTHQIERVHLLKVDVEGYECEVLKGAQQTLAKTERILIECIPRNLNRARATVEELLELLSPHFTLYTKTSDGSLTPHEYNPEATDWPDLIGLNHRYVAKG